MDFTQQYILTNKSFLLMSELEKERIYSIIYDETGMRRLPLSASKVIRASIRHYGHTFKSVTNLSKEFFGDSLQKLPICLTTSYNGPCVFFPLWAPRTTLNIWVNANTVTNISQHPNGTRLTLKYGHEVTIPFQYLAFCSLYVRASMFSNYIQTNKYL